MQWKDRVGVLLTLSEPTFSNFSVLSPSLRQSLSQTFRRRREQRSGSCRCLLILEFCSWQKASAEWMEPQVPLLVLLIKHNQTTNILKLSKRNLALTTCAVLETHFLTNELLKINAWNFISSLFCLSLSFFFTPMDFPVTGNTAVNKKKRYFSFENTY